MRACPGPFLSARDLSPKFEVFCSVLGDQREMQDALAASAVNASFVSRRRVVSSYTVRSLGTKIAFAPPQPFRVRALQRSRRSKRRTRVRDQVQAIPAVSEFRRSGKACTRVCCISLWSPRRPERNAGCSRCERRECEFRFEATSRIELYGEEPRDENRLCAAAAL